MGDTRLLAAGLQCRQMKARVFLLGRGLFREAIRSLIRDHAAVDVVGEAESWEQALQTMPPDVDAVVVDRSTPLTRAAWSVLLQPVRHVVVSLESPDLVVYDLQILPASAQALTSALIRLPSAAGMP